MIPILQAAMQISDRVTISRDFHRWLGLVRIALHGPFIGQQESGSVAVDDRQYAVHAKRLQLNAKERLSLKGTARLVICG